MEDQPRSKKRKCGISFIIYLDQRFKMEPSTENSEYNYDAQREHDLKKRQREEEGEENEEYLKSQLNEPMLQIDREGFKNYAEQIGFGGKGLPVFTQGLSRLSYIDKYNDFVWGLSKEQQFAVTALHSVHPDFVDLNFHPQMEKDLIERFNKTHDFLTIKPSKYGRGLFATHFIPKNMVIGKYPGVKVPKVVAEQLPMEYDKIVDFGGNSVIGNVQNYKYFSGLPYMNDPGYGKREGVGPEEYDTPRQRQNVTESFENNRVVFYSQRDIAPGEELLWHYGHNYWQDQRGYYPNETLYKAAQKIAKRNEKKKK